MSNCTLDIWAIYYVNYISTNQFLKKQMDKIITDLDNPSKMTRVLAMKNQMQPHLQSRNRMQRIQELAVPSTSRKGDQSRPKNNWST